MASAERALKRGVKKTQKVEILKRARKMLARPKGWVRGTWCAPTFNYSYRSMCLATACQEAAREMNLLKPEEFGMYSTHVANEVSLLKLVREEGHLSVPSFNDASGRKKKDVLALLDKRIAQLEAEIK